MAGKKAKRRNLLKPGQVPFNGFEGLAPSLVILVNAYNMAQERSEERSDDDKKLGDGRRIEDRGIVQFEVIAYVDPKRGTENAYVEMQGRERILPLYRVRIKEDGIELTEWSTDWTEMHFKQLGMNTDLEHVGELITFSKPPADVGNLVYFNVILAVKRHVPYDERESLADAYVRDISQVLEEQKRAVEAAQQSQYEQPAAGKIGAGARETDENAWKEMIDGVQCTEDTLIEIQVAAALTEEPANGNGRRKTVTVRSPDDIGRLLKTGITTP